MQMHTFCGKEIVSPALDHRASAVPGCMCESNAQQQRQTLRSFISERLAQEMLWPFATQASEEHTVA